MGNDPQIITVILSIGTVSKRTVFKIFPFELTQSISTGR